MSYEPNSSTPTTTTGLSIAIALFSLAMSIMIAAQISAAAQQRNLMSWQLENLGKQKDAFANADKEYIKTEARAEQTVQQAQALNENWAKVFTDIVDLAKDDKDAAEVVAKFGIQKNQPAETKTEDAKATEAKKEESKKEDAK